MTPLEQAYADHRRLLWGLSYRMLGTTADADEIVQETFERALRRPPSTDRPLRPWLVRVTLNAARDRLKRRRRSPYVGPWLPSPIDELGPGAQTVRAVEPTVDPELPGERLEHMSYALLVALERLTPSQRAVWLLREVMGVTTNEAAEILEVEAGTVKVTLHRARKALDAEPTPRSDLVEGMAAVGALAQGILAGDVDRVIALLSDDAVALTDGGGVYHAARRPVQGASAVARMLIGLASKSQGATYDPLWIGGCPGMLASVPVRSERFASLVVTLFGVQDGIISRVWTISAPGKLDV